MIFLHLHYLHGRFDYELFIVTVFRMQCMFEWYAIEFVTISDPVFSSTLHIASFKSKSKKNLPLFFQLYIRFHWLSKWLRLLSCKLYVSIERTALYQIGIAELQLKLNEINRIVLWFDLNAECFWPMQKNKNIHQMKWIFRMRCASAAVDHINW